MVRHIDLIKMAEKKEKKKKPDHKIINSEKAINVITKIEKLFEEEGLTMIDIEYIVGMLRRTVDIWDRGKGEEAWILHKLITFMKKLREEQIRRDL